MKFASVRELKNSTSALLRRAKNGEGILITSHGKPVAALTGISEEDIEDFVLSSHSDLRRSLDDALEEYREKGGTSVDKIIGKLKKRHGKHTR